VRLIDGRYLAATDTLKPVPHKGWLQLLVIIRHRTGSESRKLWLFVKFCNISLRMSVASIPGWWPARQLKRNPVNRVFVCGRRLHPPQYGHVVNFPRLELPLKGTYENQMEIEGEASSVNLEPGSALFAAPNCWNLPTWRPGLELLSILFGRKQLGVSLISASGRQFTHVESKNVHCPPAHGANAGHPECLGGIAGGRRTG
jgi:hypothetical protein